MSRLSRIAPAAAVLAAMAAAPAAAQAPPLPQGAVARVGNEHVSKRAFRHWMQVAVRSDSDAKRSALRESTMLYLLHRTWTRQEAAARGIVVKPGQVRRRFERQRRGAFPDEAAYRRFLERSGMTEADLLERIEFDMLQQRLTRTATRNLPAVTKQEVDRYHERHGHRFSELPPREARRAIRRHLEAVREQRSITRFIERFRARYRAQTTCAKGYVIEACSNAP